MLKPTMESKLSPYLMPLIRVMAMSIVTLIGVEYLLVAEMDRLRNEVSEEIYFARIDAASELESVRQRLNDRIWDAQFDALDAEGLARQALGRAENLQTEVDALTLDLLATQIMVDDAPVAVDPEPEVTGATYGDIGTAPIVTFDADGQFTTPTDVFRLADGASPLVTVRPVASVFCPGDQWCATVGHSGTHGKEWGVDVSYEYEMNIGLCTFPFWKFSRHEKFWPSCRMEAY